MRTFRIKIVLGSAIFSEENEPGTVIIFESLDKEHNRLEVQMEGGVTEGLPPVDELGETLMRRLASLISRSKEMTIEYKKEKA